MLKTADIRPYIREYALPSIWCPGCGHGIAFRSLLHAMANLGLDKDNVIMTCGIGCPARAAYYSDVNGLRTPHGRAIAFATGAKMHRPETTNILLLGDGDCVGIGGNHLLHAARRNIDLTVIVLNNSNYGMTGGQVSPTTPIGKRTATTTLGNLEAPIDISRVAIAAGATFVARTTSYHVPQMVSLIEKAIQHKGFSLIECISPCPTSYGRRNGYSLAPEMYRELRDCAVPIAKYETLNVEQKASAICTGVLYEEKRSELTDLVYDLMEQAKLNKRELFSKSLAKENNAQLPQERYEIRLSGAGGQGLVTGGVMLADAGICGGLNAIQTQSYGPESRGGASKSEVVFSNKAIYYPEILESDALLVMSQQACEKYVPEMKAGSIILADETFVDTIPETEANVYRLPITQITGDQLGKTLAANVVAISALAGLTQIVSQEDLTEAVAARVPQKTKELNLSAVNLGYDYGINLRKENGYH